MAINLNRGKRNFGLFLRATTLQRTLIVSLWYTTEAIYLGTDIGTRSYIDQLLINSTVVSSLFPSHLNSQKTKIKGKKGFQTPNYKT